jgi:hypothetical protein
MNPLADDNGFAVCYPQGVDRDGIPHWNARPKISETDDIGFLSELASDLQKKHSLKAAASAIGTMNHNVSNSPERRAVNIAQSPSFHRDFSCAALGLATGTGGTKRVANPSEELAVKRWQATQFAGKDEVFAAIFKALRRETEPKAK